MAEQPRFEIRRSDEHYGCQFSVFEEGDERTFVNGRPRPVLTVDVWRVTEHGARERAAVTWPSIGDRRPAVARALAEALVLAADAADEFDRESGASR